MPRRLQVARALLDPCIPPAAPDPDARPGPAGGGGAEPLGAGTHFVGPAGWWSAGPGLREPGPGPEDEEGWRRDRYRYFQEKVAKV